MKCRTVLVMTCAIIAMTWVPAAAQPGPNAESFDLQGHRGARGLAPENTIPAFLIALELGVTTLELDVVVSADSIVVVSHEPWMSSEICSLPSGEPVPRGSRDEFNLYSMTFEEISQFDCGSRRNRKFHQQRQMSVAKPSLSDMVAATESRTKKLGRQPVLYNIETKSRPETDGIFHPPPVEFVELLIRVLEGQRVLDRTTIQSFDFRTLREARRLRPNASVSLLTDDDLTRGFDADIQELGFVPDIYSPDYDLVTPEMLSKTRKRGIRVIPWTVNDWDDMVRLKEMGVDGLITDYPDIGVRLLGK